MPLPAKGSKDESELGSLIGAAKCSQRVRGLTHNFYAYPARFSPQFVKAAIETFTKPGEVILDPFVGGGTTAVEARANSRLFIGCDISELAVYLAKVKSRPLSKKEIEVFRNSFPKLLACINSRASPRGEPPPSRNLESPEARALVRKIMLALEWAAQLEGTKLKDFGRCVVLRTGQLLINGQKELPEINVFNSTIKKVFDFMLSAAEEYRVVSSRADLLCPAPVDRHSRIFNAPSEMLPSLLKNSRAPKPKLVVTSPPYPGVHVLYHRWQLQGGKETALPFYIADKRDGKGLSHYCMHARSRDNGDRYFSLIKETFNAVHSVIDHSATIVQLVAFSKPEFQLRRYLETMEESGFQCTQKYSSFFANGSSWNRNVPSRKWYTNLTQSEGDAGNKEFLLIHKRK